MERVVSQICSGQMDLSLSRPWTWSPTPASSGHVPVSCKRPLLRPPTPTGLFPLPSARVLVGSKLWDPGRLGSASAIDFASSLIESEPLPGLSVLRRSLVAEAPSCRGIQVLGAGLAGDGLELGGTRETHLALLSWGSVLRARGSPDCPRARA